MPLYTCACHSMYMPWEHALRSEIYFLSSRRSWDQPQVCRLGSSCPYQWSCFVSPMLWHIIWIINTVIIATNNTSCEFLCSQIWDKFISKSSYRKKKKTSLEFSKILFSFLNLESDRRWILHLALSCSEAVGEGWAEKDSGLTLLRVPAGWHRAFMGGVGRCETGICSYATHWANALHTRSQRSEQRRRICADTSHVQQATVTRRLRCSLIWIYTWWGLFRIALLQTFNFSEARQPRTINQRRHRCSSLALGPGNERPNHDWWGWSPKAWPQQAPRPADLLPPLASHRPCHGPRSLLNVEQCIFVNVWTQIYLWKKMKLW